MLPTLESVLEDVRVERQYQDKKWGGWDHDDQHHAHDWIAFIAVYLGNASKAFSVGLPTKASYGAFRTAMLKIAALAVASVQWADRRIHGVS